MLGLLAVSPASAQTADPPPATVIDSFCTNVRPGYDPFADVSDSHTFARAIQCQAYAGITFGVRPGRYAPVANITRAQMASFLSRMLDTAKEFEVDSGQPGSGLQALPAYDGSNDFADVADDATHVASINRLADAGIALGGPGDLDSSSYGPQLSVSRGQMASFIARSLEHLTGAQRTAGSDYFTDDDTNVHQPNINALAEAGIAVGDGVDLFGPVQWLTRAQMSAFIMRSLGHLEAAGRVTALPPNLVPEALERGDEGPEVTELQRRLEELRFWIGPVDGIFGWLTEQAVYAFQKANELTVDGRFGAQVRAALAQPSVPAPRSTAGRVIEIDKARQLLYAVLDGQLEWVFHTSTGTEEPYQHPGGYTAMADTPPGRHTVDWQVDGWRDGRLGRMYRPKYFHADGIALHGYHAIPPYPASHGCARVTFDAMDFIWAQGLMPVGSVVLVYGTSPPPGPAV